MMAKAPDKLYYCNANRALNRPADSRKLWVPSKDWKCPQDDPTAPWVRCDNCPHAVIYRRIKGGK